MLGNQTAQVKIFHSTFEPKKKESQKLMNKIPLIRENKGFNDQNEEYLFKERYDFLSPKRNKSGLLSPFQEGQPFQTQFDNFT